MGLHLEPRDSALKACAARMELEWADWQDNWESFEEYVRGRGNPREIQVLDSWPKEFKAAALDKAKRLDNWQKNRLMGWLDSVDRLTRAKRAITVKNADGSTQLEEVDDNSTQLSALKFLIENVVGAAAPKEPKGQPKNPQGGIKIDETLAQQLRDMGVRLSEQRTERSIEFRSGLDGEPEPPRHTDPGRRVQEEG